MMWAEQIFTSAILTYDPPSFLIPYMVDRSEDDRKFSSYV